MVETEAAAAVTVTVTAGYIRSPTAAERAGACVPHVAVLDKLCVNNVAFMSVSNNVTHTMYWKDLAENRNP